MYIHQQVVDGSIPELSNQELSEDGDDESSLESIPSMCCRSESSDSSSGDASASGTELSKYLVSEMTIAAKTEERTAKISGINAGELDDDIVSYIQTREMQWLLTHPVIILDLSIVISNRQALWLKKRQKLMSQQLKIGGANLRVIFQNCSIRNL